ncbi:hypothetical protein ESCO_001529 [Escovopsis weberi]|uniref:Condensation domain-containing protein n=1 Tax=Escovopsis weberi TaxID=150374 RepID=A0A0M8N2F1_ESCWE|nr:hypothetical protein ESCO_001529 [Escovopsis weberi]
MMRRLLVILQEQGNKPATIQDIQQWSVLAKQPNEQRARQARKSFWMEYLREVRPASSGKHITPETGAEIGTTTRQARVSYLKRAAVGDLRGLRALTSRHGVSLQALFLAAYAKTLSAHGGGGDIVFGVYLASRLGAEDLPTTLPTLNLVPLRARAAAACRDARLADVAWQIQDDIHAIGSGARARVGLWEIAHWTGITVDSFVNFFNGIERLEEGGSGGVRATLAERGGDDEETEEEEEEEEEEDYRYSARAWERFRGPAIDVEAAVKDGALDVGVFGSRRRISDDAAAALVDDIVGYLSAAASEA